MKPRYVVGGLVVLAAFAIWWFKQDRPFTNRAYIGYATETGIVAFNSNATNTFYVFTSQDTLDVIAVKESYDSLLHVEKRNLDMGEGQ